MFIVSRLYRLKRCHFTRNDVIPLPPITSRRHHLSFNDIVRATSPCRTFFFTVATWQCREVYYIEMWIPPKCFLVVVSRALTPNTFARAWTIQIYSIISCSFVHSHYDSMSSLIAIMVELSLLCCES